MMVGRISKLSLVALAAVTLASCGPQEPETTGGQRNMRRLSEAQYRNTIADIFGPDIKIAGRFEPIVRPRMELLATGTSLAAISPAGFEQYDTMARSIATQVVDQAHRDTLLPCKPADTKAVDEKCAAQFYRTAGRQLLRRPLADDEVKALNSVAAAGTKHTGDFYAGLASGLASLMVAPEFLFRVESVEADPARSGRQRLDGFAKAARLSYFIWNTTPDEQLLQAAERGELHTAKGLEKQVERMLASRRVVDGTRAFLTDMLEFERFEELAKDPVIYPKFSREIARDAQEQTLRTAVHLLIDQDGDYRDLFTTRQSFISRPLGVVYRLPVTTVSGWEPVEFAPESGRAGIINQLGFLSVFSHAGRSSATLRGKALREVVMCQKVPDPPGDVDFTVVQDTTNADFRTARSRLTAHRTDPQCAGCHKIMDPVGLSLENFDGLGEFRTTENGEAIDASGDLDGVAFHDPASLGQAVHDNPATTACLVKRVFEYATGRTTTPKDRAWLEYLDQGFAADDHKIRALIERIATSKAFFEISDEPEAPVRAASANHTAEEKHP